MNYSAGIGQITRRFAQKRSSLTISYIFVRKVRFSSKKKEEINEMRGLISLRGTTTTRPYFFSVIQ